MTSMEDILRKVADEVFAECQEFIESSLTQSKGNVNKIKEETINEISKIVENSRRLADATKARILSSAHISSRSKILNALDKGLDTVIKHAMEKIRSNVIKGKSYENSIESLLEEGINALGKDEVIVESNKETIRLLKSIAQRISRRLNVKVSVSPNPIECTAGLVVKSKDGSVIYDNTVEARLERMRADVRRKVVELLGKEVKI